MHHQPPAKAGLPLPARDSRPVCLDNRTTLPCRHAIMQHTSHHLPLLHQPSCMPSILPPTIRSFYEREQRRQGSLFKWSGLTPEQAGGRGSCGAPLQLAPGGSLGEQRCSGLLFALLPLPQLPQASVLLLLRSPVLLCPKQAVCCTQLLLQVSPCCTIRVDKLSCPKPGPPCRASSGSSPPQDAQGCGAARHDAEACGRHGPAVEGGAWHSSADWLAAWQDEQLVGLVVAVVGVLCLATATAGWEYSSRFVAVRRRGNAAR